MQPAPAHDLPTEPPSLRDAVAIPLEILIAPRRAFEAIARTPSWLPSYLIIVVLGLIETMLMAPVLYHLASLAPPPADLPIPATAAQIDEARDAFVVAIGVQASALPLLVAFATATILTAVARARHLTTTYATMVLLAMACAVPNAVGSVVDALFIHAQNPATFATAEALGRVAPTSLGVFASPNDPGQLRFFPRIDIFEIWSQIALGLGYAKLTGIPVSIALAIAFAIDLGTILLFP